MHRRSLSALSLPVFLVALLNCGSQQPAAAPSSPPPSADTGWAGAPGADDPPPPAADAKPGQPWQLRCGIDDGPQPIFGARSFPTKGTSKGDDGLLLDSQAMAKRAAAEFMPRRRRAPRPAIKPPPPKPLIKVTLQKVQSDPKGKAAVWKDQLNPMLARACNHLYKPEEKGGHEVSVAFATTGTPTLAQTSEQKPLSAFDRCVLTQLCSIDLPAEAKGTSQLRLSLFVERPGE